VLRAALVILAVGLGQGLTHLGRNVVTKLLARRLVVRERKETAALADDSL